ncbi:hypothetical protein CROQUDRAFT_110647 [Cronartium quercuum f. sp. fusiforme G11]|uniref:Uncharacterized protein n=1 Tax=Cronartium quercuum f. sp. fusiforme G11 TaxID=708437 RepID=A0A9P6N8W7_9BASI|nr:hypothetical protein CROQUDRAFT_110647 [Cronartium quercuum f. sp. fusiforme G11]
MPNALVHTSGANISPHHYIDPTRASSEYGLLQHMSLPDHLIPSSKDLASKHRKEDLKFKARPEKGAKKIKQHMQKTKKNKKDKEANQATTSTSIDLSIKKSRKAWLAPADTTLSSITASPSESTWNVSKNFVKMWNYLSHRVWHDIRPYLSTHGYPPPSEQPMQHLPRHFLREVQMDADHQEICPSEEVAPELVPSPQHDIAGPDQTKGLNFKTGMLCVFALLLSLTVTFKNCCDTLENDLGLERSLYIINLCTWLP